MRVSVNGGNYEYVLHEDGRSEVLRYGERWRDSVGDKFTYCMAAEIDQLRKQRDELLAALRNFTEGCSTTVDAMAVARAAIAMVKDES